MPFHHFLFSTISSFLLIVAEQNFLPQRIQDELRRAEIPEADLISR